MRTSHCATREDALVNAVVRERDPLVRATLTGALVACSDRASRRSSTPSGARCVRSVRGQRRPALVAAVANGPAEQRRQIAYVLAASGSVTHVTAKRDLLADRDPEVRFAALY